jgi:hypothetical protein
LLQKQKMGIKPIRVQRNIVTVGISRATKNPMAGLHFYQKLVAGA